MHATDSTQDPGGPVTPVPAELVSPGPELPPPTVAGFSLERELGRGGTGTVYLARQEPLDRLVALKVLDPQLAQDETFTARFYREARAAALFQHPNVVAVHAAGQDAESGAHWIAFEYMRGGSLEELLVREGCLPERESLELILGVARGLVFAETRGLVHRDVKPGNVLLTPDGVPKLADLGLAKQADPELAPITQQGVVIGTPYYMAPEQALGCPDLDCRADIYALGLCLWRMVTGRIPFLDVGESGAALVKVLARRLNQSLPDVREVAPGLSHGLASLLKGMTARRRRDRYTSAREVISDLERVLRGELPVGPSPTVPLKRPAPPLAGEAPAAGKAASSGSHRALAAGSSPPTDATPSDSAATARAARPGGAGAGSGAPPRPAGPGEPPRPGGPVTGPSTMPLPLPSGLTTVVEVSPHAAAPTVHDVGLQQDAAGTRGVPLTVVLGLLLGLGGGAWLLSAARAPTPTGPVAAVSPTGADAGAQVHPGALDEGEPPPDPSDPSFPPLVAPAGVAATGSATPHAPGTHAPGTAQGTAAQGTAASAPGEGDHAALPERPPGHPAWSQPWIDELGFLLAVDLPRAAGRAATLRREPPSSPARRRLLQALDGVLAALDPGLSWPRRRTELERLLVALEPRRGEPDPLRPAVDQALARWAALIRGARELRLALGDPRRVEHALDALIDLPGSWTATAQAKRVLALCAVLDAPAADAPLPGPSPALAIAELRRGAIGRVLGEELEALERALTLIEADPGRSRVAALTGAALAPFAGTELVHPRVVTVPASAGWSDLPGRGLDLELTRPLGPGQWIELQADGCALRLGADRIGLDETARGGALTWQPLAWRGAKRLLFEARPGNLLLRIPGAEPAERVFPRDPSGPSRFTVRLRETTPLRLLVVRVPR